MIPTKVLEEKLQETKNTYDFARKENLEKGICAATTRITLLNELLEQAEASDDAFRDWLMEQLREWTQNVTDLPSGSDWSAVAIGFLMANALTLEKWDETTGKKVATK